MKLKCSKGVFLGKNGFTLIELLVVVLIISILAAVALPQYQKAVERSRAVQAIAAVKTIGDAQELYYLANGEYASSLEDLDIEIPGENCSYNGLPRKCMGYFDVGPRGIGSTVIVAVSNRFTAQPTGNNSSLRLLAHYSLLRFAKDANIYCKAESKGDPFKICQSLSGGVKGSNGYYIVRP